ncbi:Epsin-3 [Rhodosporidiobolus nylandii]
MQAGKTLARAAKNLGYSAVENAVRDATSTAPYGPSVAQMNEIAAMSFNQLDCVEIVAMLDKRLNGHGKHWRHAFKALVLLEYLCLHGSFAVVHYCQDNLYVIKTLKEFQYIDDSGADVGLAVRENAGRLVSLLLDEERLRRERGNGGKSIEDSRSLSRHLADPHALSASSTVRRPRSVSQPLPTSSDTTKRLREQQREREKKELGKAMEASREDEEKRQKALKEQAGETLFGDFGDTGGPVQSEALVSFASCSSAPAPQDPMQQLHEQQLRQNQAQHAALQYQQQQEQANYLAFEQQQQLDALAQQAAFEQYQLQAQAAYAAQQQQQQMYLSPQPPSAQPQPQPQVVGQNNPFSPAAFSSSTYRPPQPSFLAPPQSASYTSSPGPSFLAPPAPERGIGRPRASTTGTMDERRQELSRAIGAGAGVDTFGNVGALRVPSGTQYASFTGHSH